ncbi:tRNA 2-thiouridine(34) synthase MnmA [Gulosibacter molinativorax]|uniref:tRNA-specific 2-thiouridylase MnmA n=1 Tax=Gulosibacter molinativorax TaxID=256821 RepID=A0ABT7C9M8_9MICO|nr:tRNA 2-thiouridine(34) synthase MnmA [Gulosibacter molinativorax]MDJ1371854.1 tRNA 2-thiouridine(34) synthase MnmA [Gulosibacter molinativorax]QUY60774.1 tRNA-specific 2-thiouridylase MnmA [Gulosibacter molinativorax]
MKVLAAMSGGVDSSVAAARAVDAGHDVVGVHLALSRAGGTLRAGSRGCCTIEDAMDARRVADELGIPFYVWDFSERFRLDVVDDFIAEYEQGRTPNPCLRCNEKIKFAALLDKAIDLGFDQVVTGHYAHIIDREDGVRELHRASEESKDQSYVLGVLTEQQLAYCSFPLGETPSKELVRAEAEHRGFVTANKPDSYDICFIPDGDTKTWLGGHIPMRPGAIVDRDGEQLGEHDGAVGFTIGQRKGLKLGQPAADGKPRFVLGTDPASNTVVVGPKEALAIGEISGQRWTWAGPKPNMDQFRCDVQIRAHGETVPGECIIRAADTATRPDATEPGIEIAVRVDEPLVGVAPGQTAVIYDGTRVVGQFTIDRATSQLDIAALAA